MKRLAMVLTLLLVCGGMAFAEDATTAAVEEPKIEDFNPNPFEAQLETSTEELTKAYEELEKLYNTFDFDQLITAYYAYATGLGTYEEIKKKFDAFEKAYPFKLVINVKGYNLAENTQDIDYPLSPDEILENDEALIAAAQLVRAGVKAKIQLVSYASRKQKIAKSFETDEAGYLGVRHFSANQLIKLEAEADGYLPYKIRFRMTKNRKKTVNLEMQTAGIKGHVYGLPALKYTGTRFYQKMQKKPIAGADLSFKHSSGKVYTCKSIASRWPFRRLKPLSWNPRAGRYFKARLLPGAYEVTVTKKGYRPFRNKLELVGSKPKDFKVQDFVLVPLFDHILTEDDESVQDGEAGTTSNDLNNPLQ